MEGFDDMYPIITNLTFLHRHPLNLGRTARGQQGLWTLNRELESLEFRKAAFKEEAAMTMKRWNEDDEKLARIYLSVPVNELIIYEDDIRDFKRLIKSAMCEIERLNKLNALQRATIDVYKTGKGNKTWVPASAEPSALVPAQMTDEGDL